MPAAHLEIASPPFEDATAAARFLADARRDLVAAAGDDIALAAAGAHPFAAPEGELNRGHHYDRVAAEYGRIARRQLVCGLQVHVAVRGADRALAVYNALRSYLPELLALAANAPFYGGQDTGLATVRPKLNELLPRQGVPPAIASWDEFAAALAWGERAGGVPAPGFWWWELRPHPAWGTLELRVPDAQSGVADAAAVIAVVHALVAWLAARFDAGDLGAAAPTWRIEENRWQALSRGGDALLADLETGATTIARDRLHALIESLGIPEASRLASQSGADRQRDSHASGGMRGLMEWLIGRYYAPYPGQ